MPADPFFLRFFPHSAVDSLDGYQDELRARLPETGRLLDLGCGDNTQLARYRTARREVWGADFHEHPRLAHRAWFRRLTADGGIPFADAAFDLVGACWVLEHVVNPAGFLQEVRRVLRPGGWFIALTPNGRHYVTRLIRLFELLPHHVAQGVVLRLYRRAHHDTFPTLYRLNTPGQLRHAARTAGLHLTGITGYPNPDYFSFSPFLRRLAIRADWTLDRLCPGLGRLYTVVVLHKPPAPASAPAGKRPPERGGRGGAAGLTRMMKERDLRRSPTSALRVGGPLHVR